MRLRAVLSLLVLLVVASTSGCVDNMDQLKEALGVRDPPPPPEPEPVYVAPLAKAQVNATSVLLGVPVRFTSDGSRDPQGLALSFRWSFGDGETATGPVVTHAYDEEGEYRVTLNVTNTVGLGHEDVVTVAVGLANRAPLVAFAVRDTGGASVTGAEQGARLRFDSAPTSDPDGDALSYLWTFGDGATSIEASPTHVYETPGLYTVRLKADDGSLSAESSRILAINGTLDERGEFTITSGSSVAHAFHVAEGAQLLVVTLTFDAALGGNDLRLVLKDAEGAEVASSSEETAPGATGEQTRNVTLAGDALRTAAPGDWSLEVERAKGVQVAYRLVARETF